MAVEPVDVERHIRRLYNAYGRNLKGDAIASMAGAWARRLQRIPDALVAQAFVRAEMSDERSPVSLGGLLKIISTLQRDVPRVPVSAERAEQDWVAELGFYAACADHDGPLVRVMAHTEATRVQAVPERRLASLTCDQPCACPAVEVYLPGRWGGSNPALQALRPRRFVWTHVATAKRWARVTP